jgi:hypothetical protein
MYIQIPAFSKTNTFSSKHNRIQGAASGESVLVWAHFILSNYMPTIIQKTKQKQSVSKQISKCN